MGGAQLVRVTMEIDGEVCLLLWQPMVGPWETLRALPHQEQDKVDVDTVLEAVPTTQCVVDASGLEQATQVQFQDLNCRV